MEETPQGVTAHDARDRRAGEAFRAQQDMGGGGLRHRVGDQESFSGVVWCEGKGFEVAGWGAG